LIQAEVVETLEMEVAETLEAGAVMGAETAVVGSVSALPSSIPRVKISF
jgi:uncharacterized protein (DUF2126 family)